MKQFEIKPVHRYGVIARSEAGTIIVTQEVPTDDNFATYNIHLCPEEGRMLANYLLSAADEMDSERKEQIAIT